MPHDTPRQRKSVPAMERGSAPEAAASASAGRQNKTRDVATTKFADQNRVQRHCLQLVVPGQAPFSILTQAVHDVTRRHLHSWVAAVLTFHPGHLPSRAREGRGKGRVQAGGRGRHGTARLGSTCPAGRPAQLPHRQVDKDTLLLLPFMSSTPLPACRRATQCRGAPCGTSQMPLECPRPEAAPQSPAQTRPHCRAMDSWV